MKADLFQSEAGVSTFSDLLQFYPFRYVDKRLINKISSIGFDSDYVQLKGKFISLELVGSGRTERLEGKFADDTGVLTLTWFRGVK